MAQELDMERRDPNGLNSHIQVNFEDVFGEPDGVRSMDCVWQNSYKCFECWKKLCYQIMTLLCGICIAMEWGCEFAALAFNHVWIWTPCMREFSITAGCCGKCLRTVLECVCSPICESCGRIFSNIKITKG